MNNCYAVIPGRPAGPGPESMNTSFPKALGVGVPGLHSRGAIGEMATPAGTPLPGLALRPLDPSASRSDTRTLEGAFARIAIRRADQAVQ